MIALLVLAIYIGCGYGTWKLLVKYDPTRAFGKGNMSFRSNGYSTFTDVLKAYEDHIPDINVIPEVPFFCFTVWPIMLLVILVDVSSSRAKISVENKMLGIIEVQKITKQLEREL